MARPKKMTPEHDRDFANMTPEATLARVVDDCKASKSFQQPYLTKFEEYYKMYRSYKDPDQFREGRSNLFIPYVFHIVETETPRIVNTLVNTRPFVQTQPLGYPADERAARAKKMDLLLDYQFQVRIRFVTRLADVAKTALMYGTAITRQGWRYEKRDVPIRRPVRLAGLDTGTRERAYESKVIYDDPFVRNVPLWDFLFDPSSVTIEEARYCAEREWMDYADVLQLERSLGVKFKNLTELKDSSRGNAGMDAENPHLSSVGLSGGTQSNRKAIEMVHYWTGEWYIIVANDKFVLLSDESPYDHGKIPYSKWIDTPVPNEFYGIGEIESVEDLQEELNVTRNQRIDNVSLIINKMFTIVRGAMIDPQQLITRAGGFIEVDDQTDVQELKFTDVTSEAYNEEDRIKSDMDRVTGVNDTTRGSEGSRRETATTMSILANAGAERFKLKVALIAYGGMTDMINQVIRLNQQFLTTERQAMILGKDGAVTGDTVTLDDILGEWDIIAIGSAIEAAVNTDIQQANITNLYSLLKDNPFLNQEEFVKNILEVFKFKNINHLVQDQQPAPPPEAAPAQAPPLAENAMLNQAMSQTNMEAGQPPNLGGAV